MLRRWLRDIGNLAGFSLAIILAFFVIAGGLSAPRVAAALAEAMRGSFAIAFASARSTPYWRLVGEALKSSIPITWVVGSVVTIMGTVTSRLQATELAL